jgi:dCMP deaminase
MSTPAPLWTIVEHVVTASQKKWDLRFLLLAKYISTFSKDPSTQTGAVIVRPNRSILSVGFNGFARSMSDAPELYANREVKYSRVIHCEVNALLLAEGPARGCTLYTWPFASCDRCCVQMLQAGIVRFVYPSIPVHLVERWGSSLNLTKKYLAEAHVEDVEIPLSDIPSLTL